MRDILSFVAVWIWVTGFIVAKGFWSTAACLCPFWGWYLAIEWFYHLVGLL